MEAAFSTTELRDKWRELPATRQDRMFAEDLMLLDDEALLEYWERCRKEMSIPQVKGWYYSYYKEMFKGKRIADIGSGLGHDGIFFAQHGAQVTFADINKESLALLERICKLKSIDAEYYYIDDFENYSFARPFDAIMCIGSLINAPFEFTQKQIGGLMHHLLSGGKVLFLGYPYERFLASGAKDGTEFGKTTDGERTPWMEWYDAVKITQLFGSEFILNWGINYGKDNIEFNFFELEKKKEKTQSSFCQSISRNMPSTLIPWVSVDVSPEEKQKAKPADYLQPPKRKVTVRKMIKWLLPYGIVRVVQKS